MSDYIEGPIEQHDEPRMGGGSNCGDGLSERIHFEGVDWTKTVPETPGAYVIFDEDELVYVGMAGRNGRGTLRTRLRDHSTGQIVNMFAQYLFLDRVQFLYKGTERITHPKKAKEACRAYIKERCSFQFLVSDDAASARDFERKLKASLNPTLNP
tara:strand:+ start:232 stop:696 length:465 start_codon:yes stop_codon:yes gene_type:complete